VTYTPSSGTVRLTLKVNSTLAKVQGSHTVTRLNLEAPTCLDPLTCQALDAKDVEAETISAVIKRFSSDAVKHSDVLSKTVKIS